MADEESGVPLPAVAPSQRSSKANLILVLLVFIAPLALIFLYELSRAR